MSYELITATELTTLNTLAKTFYESGLFSDTKSQAQALVKCMAGREMGKGPFQSMRDLNIIQGKIAMAGAAISADIKASGIYDFEIIKFEDDGAVLRFTKGGKALTPDISFTFDDAKKLGLTGKDNYQKQARTMLFWRAVTMGARMHCPQVFGGPIYTPDELQGADTMSPVDITPRAQARRNGNLEHGGVRLAVSPIAADVPQAPAPVDVPVMPADGVNPWDYVFEGIEIEGRFPRFHGHRLCEISEVDLAKCLRPANANKITPADRIAIEMALTHPELRTDALTRRLDSLDAAEAVAAENPLASAPVLA